MAAHVTHLIITQRKACGRGMLFACTPAVILLIGDSGPLLYHTLCLVPGYKKIKQC